MRHRHHPLHPARLLRRTAPTLAAAALAVPLCAASPAAAAPPEGLLCNGVAPTRWATANGQVVTGTSGNDVISANGFHGLTLNGGGGNDVVCGPPVPAGTDTGNTLVGGSGDDLLISSGGRERLIGGAGNDRLVGTIHDDVDYSTDGYAPGSVGIRVDLVAGTVTGARTGSDTVVGVDQARFFGTSGADTFLGDEEPNWFDAGAGADTVHGNGGNDWIHAVAPALADGGTGNDTITVGYGGRVLGGTGNDLLAADPNNALSGASPDRGTVTGYRLNGQDGNDTFKVNTLRTGATTWSADAAQRWRGTIRGGGGRNSVDLRWLGSQGVSVSLLSGTATWHTGSATLRSVQRVIGTPAADRLVGGNGRDALIGLAGDDVVMGRRGDDLLQGNAGDDRLLGGYGRDHADGGQGRDTCHGDEAVARCEG